MFHLNKKKAMKTFYRTLILVGSFLTGFGQNQLPQLEKNGQGVVKLMQLTERSNYKMTNLPSVFATILGMTDNDELRFLSRTVDNSGNEHQVYEQYYRGIKVEYGRYGAHGRDGNIDHLTGNFKKIQNLEIVPKLTESEALKAALSTLGSKKTYWESAEQERWIKRINNDPQASFFPKAELLICEDSSGNFNFYLTYKFIIYLLEPALQRYIYVDASSGNVIRNESIVEDINGTADTRYSGSQTVSTNTSAGSYVLQDPTRGNGIRTFDMRLAGGSYGNATDFTDNDNNWTSAEHSTNQDNVALDAHWAQSSIYDYWLNVRGRNSYNSAGGAVTNYVHTNLTAFGYANNDNAFWDGNLRIMVYGDGQTLFNPVTSLDICAHELGHGIAQSIVNFSRSGEANALNEGFSDIWGATVEAYVAPGKQRWLIGEEVMKNGKPCLRSMQNPISGGNDPNPDVYQGLYWDNGGEPHINSTVLSHWYYLLSQGGSGRNSAGTGYAISGIGIDKASLIAYTAETNYFSTNSNATYSDARNYMIQAATNQYGNCSPEVIATTNAWYAAGVGYATGSPFGTYSFGTNVFVFTGSTGISVSNSNPSININVANYGPSATYNWTISSQTGNSSHNFSGPNASIYLNGGASLNVTCNITNTCGSYSVSFNCYNYSGSFRMAAYPNPASQEMTVAAVKGSDQDDAQFQDNSMAADRPVEDSDLVDVNAEVRLVDKNNGVVKTGKLLKGKLSFSVVNLPDGIYYLQMSFDDKQIRKQIIVKH